MNDQSVIVNQNNKVAKEALIKRLKQDGKAVLVERVYGIDSIGDIRSYNTATEAKQAALGLKGEWSLA